MGPTDGRTVHLLYASQSSFGGITKTYYPIRVACCYSNQHNTTPYIQVPFSSRVVSIRGLSKKFVEFVNKKESTSAVILKF